MTGGNRAWGDEGRWSDVLVIGAGAAGLTCALEAAPLRVTLLSKLPVGQGGNSPWAQGGVAAAVGADDSPALHAEDTLAAGAGLCDPRVVEWLTREAPARLRALVHTGARFDRDPGGDLALGREAAHRRDRILHARDATGAEIVRALVDAVRRASHVRVEDTLRAVDLVVHDGRVVGVVTIGEDGRRVLFLGRAVVLATGGLGRAFRHTTNPPEATGDGLAIAARAGAVLADLEFVQFHPTALDVEEDPRPLLTEALRGRGATLIDETGRRFVLDAHPDGELAPRDIVSRAIWAHAARGHRVFLDARAAVGAAFASSFPTVYEVCQRHGIDPAREPIPVTPAAHYHMGGVAVDTRGRTSLEGLWACGEVACTGLHGANRLASNSLLEALVCGAAVAADVAASPSKGSGPAECEAPEPRRWANAADADEGIVSLVRHVMWSHVGLVRDDAGLRTAVHELVQAEARAAGHAAASLALVGRLVATAALARVESRGGHYRVDAPEPRAAWRRRAFWRLERSGRIVPAVFTPAGAPAREDLEVVA